MKKIALCSITIILVFIQGCCSIFNGGPQDITVNSIPQGAKVKIGPYKGIAPYKVSIPKGKNYTITATYENETKTESLHKSIDGIYWANILIWPGLIVDAATGKMYKYDPNKYTFKFKE